MVLRVFRYRLYPKRIQVKRLINSCIICKEAYNKLLNYSINSYKNEGKKVSKFDFNNVIKRKYDVHSQVLQNVSDRLSKAFQNFFRRVKERKRDKKVKVGFPRFKKRVISITYPQSGFKFIDNKRLYISKIGNIPIILHRLPRGKIKTLTIKQNKSNQWFACLVCEIPDVQVINSNPDIGIDVGLKELAVLSNGIKISNPKFLIKSEKRLKLLHRRHSKKKKGSKNKLKLRFGLAKQYLKVSNQRSDYLHKVTHELTSKYNTFKVEKLNIQNMVRNHHLAKSINDVSWNQFIQYLSYKASSAGGQVIEVNPRNTTKRCSKCGNLQRMPLNKRTYKCSNCGLIIDRDLNASINIKNTDGLSGIHACGKDVRLFNEKQTSMNQELHNNIT